MAAPGVPEEATSLDSPDEGRPSAAAEPIAAASESEDGDEDHEAPTTGSPNDIPPRLRAQRALPAPNRRISPFDVRFSQMRARHEFRDARLLEDSVKQIRAVRCEASESTAGATWRLEAPFPPIEVLQWRCKLRDEATGRPRLDPTTGDELWDTSDRWFTLDNRRLYCLQKAAVALWPERAAVDVVELPPGPLTRMRELKKFRNIDRGRSIFIGGRKEGETLVRWSWRQAAGVPDDAESEEDSSVVIGEPMQAFSSSAVGEEGAEAAVSVEHGAGRVQLRQPRRRHGRGIQGSQWERQQRGPGSRGARRNSDRGRPAGSDPDVDLSLAEKLMNVPWTSVLAFLVIYMMLRIGMKMFAAYKISSGEAGTSPPQTLTSVLINLADSASVSEAAAFIQRMPLSILVFATVLVLALLVWSLAYLGRTVRGA